MRDHALIGSWVRDMALFSPYQLYLCMSLCVPGKHITASPWHCDTIAVIQEHYMTPSTDEMKEVTELKPII